MSILNLKRYENPVLIEHLASHYVLGSMSKRVRARTQKVAKQSKELREQIYIWQMNFEAMNQCQEKVPPKNVWKKLKQKINPDQENRSIFKLLNQLVWKLSSAVLAIALVIIISLPTQNIQNPILGYTASMQNNDAQSEFVINVYKDNQAGNTFIKFLINQRVNDTQLDGVLWAKGFDSEELIKIGNINELLTQNVLTKEQWGVIKSSKTLIVTKDESVQGERLYEGECIQLGDWG